jgi:hypothetical protein
MRTGSVGTLVIPKGGIDVVAGTDMLRSSGLSSRFSSGGRTALTKAEGDEIGKGC